MALALNGIGVSRGIAIGPAQVLQRDDLEVLESSIPPQHVEDEVVRFQAAVRAAKQQLRAIRSRIPASTTADITAFIDTHLLMLEDATLSLAPVHLIRSRLCNAEWALKLQRDSVVTVFEAMDDPYLRTRKDDVDHVVSRILRILLSGGIPASQDQTPAKLKGRIVLADDLTPADTVLMQHEGIAAFVTESGGPLSHTAILARSLGIPAVVGAHHARRYIRDQELLIVDGSAGVILADPDEASLKHYRKRQREEKRYYAELARLRSEPAVTRDGQAITLQANVELPEDLRAVRKVGAAGIGLYRTEYLFMNRCEPPSEDEQLQAYLRVLHALKGAPVTIRTLDLGADKQVDGGRDGRAMNPALGLRAIRLCLRDLNLFRPQLRAILRASAAGPVRIMIPMLSNLQELEQVLALIEETKHALEQEGLKFDERVPVGGMIEVPAAALSAHLFARRLDFLSLGTNDLIQYTLAIDRVDDEVNYLYDPLHPAVLQLIEMTIRAGRAAGIPVGMCGEMAGDTRYTRLLLGMGLTDFSMHPSSLLEVKRIIQSTRIGALGPLARRVLRAGSAEEMAALMEKMNRI
jgi:phosphoenolpyruvate-protein phosphotransferase (PTS system enzyme I)